MTLALSACAVPFAFATPQTTFKAGEAQIDLGAWDPDASDKHDSTDRKWNFDGGVTYAMTDKLALQYQYYGLKTNHNGNIPETNGSENEVNVIYSLHPDIAVYAGWNSIKNSGGFFDGNSKTNNIAQLGVIGKYELGHNFDVYAKGALGTDKTTIWEAGIGYTFVKDLDLSVGYRSLNTKEGSSNRTNVSYKGFIAGLSYRFGGPRAEAAAVAPAVVETPAVTYQPTEPAAPVQKLDYYINSVHFDTDVDTPLAADQPILDDFVSQAKAHPDNLFKIVGYTDSQGSDTYNEDLSKRRVENVEKYAEDRGVPASQLKATYHGEKKPASTNDTEQGRADNRRVDIYINK